MFEEYFSPIGDIRSNRYVLSGDFLEGWRVLRVVGQLDIIQKKKLFYVPCAYIFKLIDVVFIFEIYRTYSDVYYVPCFIIFVGKNINVMY